VDEKKKEKYFSNTNLGDGLVEDNIIFISNTNSKNSK
jgi:hypothetical protein